MSRQVAQNAIWNVFGTSAAFVVGIVAVPVLLRVLGAGRLGIFTLALGLIGFSGLLDLGLGRSLTQSVSSALARGRPRQAVAALVWKVIRLLVFFGMFWSFILWFSVPFITRHLFQLEGQLAAETIFGLRAVALSIPFALAATVLVGALEGLQEFRLVSTRKALLSSAQFGLPTLVALWRPDVGFVIAALALSRALSVCVWLPHLHRVLPLPDGLRAESQDFHHLLRFGGWLSVSNVVGPLMAYADRFYLASVFSPALVATYTVPYDAMSRVTSLPMTAVGAIFPALSEAQENSRSSTTLLNGAITALVAIMLPPLLLALVFAKPILLIWLGKNFAASTLAVFQILIVGVFMNSAAHVPYALLQAHGRSDLTAKLHLVELPLFVGLFLWAVSIWGVVGAAIAWTTRVSFDAVLLYGATVALQPKQRSVLIKGCVYTLLAALTLLVPLIFHSVVVLIIVCAAALSTCCLIMRKLYFHWRDDAARVGHI